MTRACFTIIFLLASAAAYCDDNGLSDDRPVKHRTQFSLSFLDSATAEVNGMGFAYTYSLTPKSNLSLQLSWLNVNVEGPNDSGIGDTTLSWSWVPFVKTSVRPWVPNEVGSGVSITLPTGDAVNDRSMDSIIITPFLGLVVPLMETPFTLYPSISYAYSTDTIVSDEYLRIGTAELGLNWVHDSGWWISIFGTYIKDFEADKTYLNWATQAGKLISDRWAISASYDKTEFFMPGSAPVLLQDFDYELALNLTYSF